MLLVFQGENALAAVLHRLLARSDLDAFRGLIASSTIERLQRNFQDWHYIRQGNITAGGLV